MRQTITNFAASIGFEGLTQSRFPSQVMQLIAGFSLYWVLQVCDHHLFFGDTAYSRSLLPRIDGVLDFFASYVDDKGLVSGLPRDVWQYVDWVTTWGVTDDHPDKGVPTSGRKSNLHTYFSMLYAYVLREAAKLLIEVGRPAHAEEYESRARSLQVAVRTHCYDGDFFTDSTSDIAGEDAYSQHCQVFAVLCGAAEISERTSIVYDNILVRDHKITYPLGGSLVNALYPDILEVLCMAFSALFILPIDFVVKWKEELLPRTIYIPRCCSRI